MPSLLILRTKGAGLRIPPRFREIVFSLRDFRRMIKVTHLNGDVFFLNAELIEYMQSGPSTTVITLVTGKKIAVREPESELVARILDYRREIGRARPEISEVLAKGR